MTNPPSPVESPAPATTFSFAETFSIGLGVATLDDTAVEKSVSSTMGMLWPILFGVIGSVASPALINPLAWIPLALVGGVGFFILVGYCHLVSMLFGGSGAFDTLLKAAGTGSLPRWLSVIPFLNWVGMVWYAVIMVKVLQRVYGYGPGAAVLVVALPFLLIMLGSILLAIGVFSLGILGMN